MRGQKENGMGTNGRVDKMKTDLPWFNKNNLVVLIQPGRTIGQSKGQVAKNPTVESRYGSTKHLLEEIFNETMAVEGLRHAGMIGWQHQFVYGYYPCGGRLELMSLPPPEKRGDEFCWMKNPLLFMYLGCSSPECGLKLALCTGDENDRFAVPLLLQNALLHLMLKQMEPRQPFANFIDCRDSGRQEVDDLGLVSIVHGCAYGSTSDNNHSGHFPLAFTLVPGMDTLNGADGFEHWARYLRQKKTEWDSRVIDRWARMLITGPRPMAESQSPFRD
jgi:hypothetical protein